MLWCASGLPQVRLGFSKLLKGPPVPRAAELNAPLPDWLNLDNNRVRGVGVIHYGGSAYFMTQEALAGVHIVAILGSVRPANFTAKALALVADEMQKRGMALDVVDPARLTLPPPGIAPDTPDAQALRKRVARATGVILATPEYHGSFSSVMKLVIENLGFPSVLAGKPVALLGVAAGQIGAIKSLEALASVCTHVGAIVLPGAASVAGVQQLFDSEGRCLDAGVEKRIRSVAANLIDYIHGNICPRMALEEIVRGTARVA